MNLGEVLFLEKDETAEIIAKTYEVEGGIWINRNSQISTLFYSDTGESPNHSLKLIVTPSWCCLIMQLNVLHLPAVNNKVLFLKGDVLIHVHIGSLEVPVWFGVVDELVAEVLLRSFVIDR